MRARVAAAPPKKGVGPLKTAMHQAGPGHFVGDAVQLIPGGTWVLTVSDRVSDFDEYTAKIRPRALNDPEERPTMKRTIILATVAAGALALPAAASAHVTIQPKEAVAASRPCSASASPTSATTPRR